MKKKKRIRPAALWRRPWIGAAVLAVVAVLAIAGCGGSSSSGGSASSSGSTSEESGSTSPPAAGPGAGKFEISEEARTCLKEHGFEPPAGGKPGGEGGPPPGGFSGGGGPGGGKFKEAFEACGIEGPAGKPGGAPPTNSAAFKSSVKEYVVCVRENGYEMPEPNLSGEGPVFNKSEVNQEDPKFKAASEKCESILHGGGGGGESS